MISKKWYRTKVRSFSYGELKVNGDLEEFTSELCISDITIVTARRKAWQCLGAPWKNTLGSDRPFRDSHRPIETIHDSTLAQSVSSLPRLAILYHAC